MATKKAAVKKAAPKKSAPAKEVKKGPGKIAQILALHGKGKTLDQIEAAGFNRTTASIQIAKFKKANGGK
jgi:hypothetical protein